jgi:hypothetical protein
MSQAPSDVSQSANLPDQRRHTVQAAGEHQHVSEQGDDVARRRARL